MLPWLLPFRSNLTPAGRPAFGMGRSSGREGNPPGSYLQEGMTAHAIPRPTMPGSRAYRGVRTCTHQLVPPAWGRRFLHLAAPVMSSMSGEAQDRHLDPALAGARPCLCAPRGLEDARLLSSCRASSPLELALAATQDLLRAPSQQLVRASFTTHSPQPPGTCALTGPVSGASSMMSAVASSVAKVSSPYALLKRLCSAPEGPSGSRRCDLPLALWWAKLLRL